ncbi:hypothetical protein V5799_021094, partial [Amblyomma americanum]
MEIQFGASFSPANGKLFLDANTGRLTQGIANLISRGFLHFGILNLYGAYSTKQTLIKSLKILKEIAEFRTYKTYPHTFIGVQFEDSKAETLPEELETVFKPSMYIAITHVSQPDFPQCRTLPMTMLQCPSNNECNERTIVQAMKRQDSEGRRRMTPYFAISFSMRGHWYAPPNTEATVDDIGLFKPCLPLPIPFDFRPNL